MRPEVVNITEAKAKLSRLVEEAAAGKRVLICKAGNPMAVLQAYETDPGAALARGVEGTCVDAEDFDDPLPEDLQQAFEGAEA